MKPTLTVALLVFGGCFGLVIGWFLKLMGEFFYVLIMGRAWELEFFEKGGLEMECRNGYPSDASLKRVLGYSLSVGVPWALLVIVTSGELTEDIIRGGAICFLLIVSALAFYIYGSEKGQKYFLADLPFRGIRRWALFLVMFPVGWPFLAVSRIRMALWRRRQN